MKTPRMTRRTFLSRAAVISAAASLPTFGFLPSPARAAGEGDASRLQEAIRRLQKRHDRVLTGKPSRNGWEMEKVADNRGNIYTRPVPGTPLDGVQVRMGDVETILVHVIRRFHYEIDELRAGDVVGWRSPGAVRKWLAESNQASGTAVQIRPGHYPAGIRGGFFPLQEVVIRDILAELDGVVRWGGDDAHVDEALFSIDVKPGDDRLARVANRIRGWKDEPGQGAGASVDVTSRTRRAAAKAMQRRQRTTAA
jgi:hypothetical protein